MLGKGPGVTQNGPENYQFTRRLRWKKEEEQMLHLWRATQREYSSRGRGGAGSSEGIRHGGRKVTGREKRALCGGGLPPSTAYMGNSPSFSEVMDTQSHRGPGSFS